MKLAAIDIGSNSLHLVVVEVDATGSFRVIGREKAMVRLGARSLRKGRLTKRAVERALAALARFKQQAQSQGVVELLAVATSAVREASNGEQFLERIGKQLGFWPRAISGEEEARLIHLAAIHSVHLEDRRTLVVDIGGGSVELVLGTGSTLQYVASEKLGVLRMAERFVHSDPLVPRDAFRLEAEVQRVLKPHLPHLRGRFDCVVGTSGTILALGSLVLESSGSLHHATVTTAALAETARGLATTHRVGRLELQGLAERADTIVAGGVILRSILESVKAREIVLCEWALREGLLLDYIHSHPRFLAQTAAYPDIRRRSVVSLAERCRYQAAHASQVAALAMAVFDATRRRHRLGRHERELLEFAALLHDIGHVISYPGHHKHTEYLIRNGDLRGFQPQDIQVIASTARYHRRALPRRQHAGFRKLTPAARTTVEVLAGCLRIADALDRSHRQQVRLANARLRGDRLTLACEAPSDWALEAWGAESRKGLLESALGLQIEVTFSRRRGASAEASRAELASGA